MLKHLFVALSGLAFLFIASACHGNKTDKKESIKSGAAAVEVCIVKPSPLLQTISVPGTLLAANEIQLVPEIAGRVVQLNLSEGNPVKQGTLLVKLADSDLQAQLLKMNTQLKIAQSNQKRQEQLLKISGVSQSDMEQADLQVESAKADLEVLKAQIRKTEIVAPFDGTIGLRNVSLGAEVTPGSQLAVLRTQHQLKIDFTVPEKYGPLIKPGGAVRFTLTDNSHYYTARVLATEQGIDAATRSLKVRAAVTGATAGALPGAFANVEVVVTDNLSALLIPTQAVIPQDQGKKVIVSHGGKAVFVPIITGFRQPSSVEVLSGLKAGDTVLTTGILFIKPGMPVTISRIIP